MTFATIVAQVMARLNLTSAAASARVLDDAVEVYKGVLGQLGLETTSLAAKTATTANATTTVMFTGTEKVLSVFNWSGLKMDEVPYNVLQNMPLVAEPPTAYAIKTVTTNAVTIQFNSSPTVGHTLTATVVADLTPDSIVGTDTPAFPSLYHDLLVHGAMAIELLKMEKPALAKAQQDMAEARVLQLKQFLDAGVQA